MRNIQRIFFVGLFLWAGYGFAQRAESEEPAANSLNRDEIVENELQAAAGQARIEEKEQTQENFLKIQNETNTNVGDAGHDYDRSHNDSIKNKTQASDKPLLTQESTQQNFQNFQKNVGKDLENAKSEVERNNTVDFQKDIDKFNDPRTRLKKIDVALEIASFNYQTDENFPNNYAYFYPVGNAVKKAGALYGIHSSYTYRRPYKFPVHAWKDLSRAAGGPGELFTFARIEGDASFGKISYESFATGKRKNFNAWQGDFRALGGYDFLSRDSSLIITPYTGLGYRHFSDKTGGWVDWVVTNYVPYENVFNILYMPVGIETLKNFNDEWDFDFKLEGDIILYGTVDFNHSDIPGVYTITDFQSGLPVQVNLEDASSTLRGGYGFKTSFKMIKKFEKFNIYVEPFFDLWKLRKSKSEVDRAHGLNGIDYHSVNLSDGSAYKPLFEAANYTLEGGMRLGVQF